jgi:hypothetical protein
LGADPQGCSQRRAFLRCRGYEGWRVMREADLIVCALTSAAPILQLPAHSTAPARWAERAKRVARDRQEGQPLEPHLRGAEDAGNSPLLGHQRLDELEDTVDPIAIIHHGVHQLSWSERSVDPIQRQGAEEAQFVLDKIGCRCEFGRDRVHRDDNLHVTQDHGRHRHTMAANRTE